MRELRLLVLGALVSCAPAAPTTVEIPEAKPAPAVASASASAPVPRPLLPPCEAIARLQTDAFDDAKKDAKEAPLFSHLEAAAGELPKCFAFAGGAWGFVAHSPLHDCGQTECDPDGSFYDMFTVSVDMVLAAPSGDIQRATKFVIEHGGQANNRLMAAFFDYDGDGVPELLLSENQHVHETRDQDRTTVWTGTAAGIDLYAAAHDFLAIDVQDIDGDGRPDLDMGPAYAGVIVPCGIDGIDIEVGPHRFAHSLAGGTFAFDDEPIRALFRKECPTKPKTLVPRKKGGIDNDALRHNVVCARLWGTKSKDTFDAITTGCRGLTAPVDNCAYEGIQTACVNQELLMQWAVSLPPVRLDEEPRSLRRLADRNVSLGRSVDVRQTKEREIPMKHRLVIAALGLSLAAVACGKSDSSASPDTTTKPATAAATPTPTKAGADAPAAKPAAAAPQAATAAALPAGVKSAAPGAGQAAPDVASGTSAPPSVEEWNTAAAVNTAGANTQAKDCTMKVVREWLKVNCTGPIKELQNMDGFGTKGSDYYELLTPGKVADLVVRMKKGGSLKVRILRDGVPGASLFMNWPAQLDKPSIIALATYSG